MIGIIDYGAGNLHSVLRALEYLQVHCGVVKSPGDFKGAEKLILPGVGHFGAAARELCKRRLDSFLCQWIADKRPILGICVGLQLFLCRSEEATGVRGLGVLSGQARLFPGSKVPQIGWNQVEMGKGLPLLIEQGCSSYFYFLHSYYLELDCTDGMEIGWSEYNGVCYPSLVMKDKLLGVQFHPEKSGSAGLKLLEKWVNLC